jgi:hypothetical protein
MFTIEMLNVEWDDRDNPDILQRMTCHTKRLGDANIVARSLLDGAEPNGPNAFRILDGNGSVVVRSWERKL